MLHSQDGDVVSAGLLSGRVQVEVDLTRAEDDLLDLLWSDEVLVGVLKHSPKPESLSEVLKV